MKQSFGEADFWLAIALASVASAMSLTRPLLSAKPGMILMIGILVASVIVRWLSRRNLWLVALTSYGITSAYAAYFAVYWNALTLLIALLVIAAFVIPIAVRMSLTATLTPTAIFGATFVLLGGFFSGAAIARYEPSVYIATASRFVRAHAYYAARVDWRAASRRALDRVYDMSPNWKRVAIGELLTDLRDRHSTFIPASLMHDIMEAKGAEFRVFPPTTRLLGDVGYLDEQGVGPGSASDRYMRVGVSAVRAVEAGATCGWIIDLRMNSGGNIHPMLAVADAIEPHLAATYVDRYGHRFSLPARGDAASVAAAAGNAIPRRTKSIAILTSQRTASSGEGVVIALKATGKARTFGSITAGLASSNTSYVMVDGSWLNVMEALGISPDGKPIVGGIRPDTEILMNGSERGSPWDSVTASALRWIHRRCAGRAGILGP